MPNDVIVPPALIVSWSDAQIVFKVPDSVPPGKYALIVRGYKGTEPCYDISSSTLMLAVQ